MQKVNVRTKGHNFERSVVKMLREEANYKFVKTSRLASKLLDDCGVDVAGVPFLIQTKSGYAKNRPKPEVIFEEMEKNLKENFPASDKIHTFPKILIHKITDKKKYHNFVTMPYSDFKKLIKNQKEV